VMERGPTVGIGGICVCTSAQRSTKGGQVPAQGRVMASARTCGFYSMMGPQVGRGRGRSSCR
jgi:hypothetical protein